MKRRVLSGLLILLLTVLLAGCEGFGISFDPTSPVPPSSSAEWEETESESAVRFGREYTSKEEIAEYLRTYGELPPNFITKQEARGLGWEGGNLWKFAPGKSIGGDRFGNYEGLLPKAKGRVYYECDVDYAGGKRGEKRIIFSNDGLIYYTDDHYQTYELLEEGDAP